jgi:activating signal cointegrator complex subunit 3
MTEQLFECGLIKVLCCTATLAWGINLPAHTVIIKGTELYDPERGGFVDLSILDVLQIFGRAGRPQYDNTGHAILITSHKSLAPYLALLTHQAPIESSLIKALPDHLNAEIVNGTINNIKEASSWFVRLTSPHISFHLTSPDITSHHLITSLYACIAPPHRLAYTFLFIRMAKNPLSYGIDRDDLYSDPQLVEKRLQLVSEAAATLDACMMIRFDRRSGNLAVTNLGRVASETIHPGYQ